MTTSNRPLRAIALICSLKRSPAPSSSALIAEQLFDNLRQAGVDDQGRPRQVGKVALAAVVGNEDGAHKIVADLFQGLNDIGFSIPAQGCTYWNDEAMGSRDYNDLEQAPDPVASATAAAARNAAHLAALLREHSYPAYSTQS